MLKFEALKRWKAIHCYQKLFSVLLLILQGDCLVLEAGKTQKMTKIFKPEKNASFVKKLL